MSGKDYIYMDELTEDQLHDLANVCCPSHLICRQCCLDINDDPYFCYKTMAKHKIGIYDEEDYHNIKMAKGPLLKYKIIKE